MKALIQTKTKMTNLPPFTSDKIGLLQQKCACGNSLGIDGECEECRSKQLGLQRSVTSHTVPSNASPTVHDVLRSPGQPLDAGTRAFMESRFGHDFNQVRIHTDAKAAESTRTVNALAYTFGRNVVFGAGQYRPSSVAGKKLLAHELAHTLQQGDQTPQLATELEISKSDDVTEREAEKAARSIINDQPFAVASQGMGRIARQESDDEKSQEGADREGFQTYASQTGFESRSTIPLVEFNKATKSSEEISSVEQPQHKKRDKLGKKLVPQTRIVIDQPTQNIRFPINAVPQMPAIPCRARVIGVSPDPTSQTRFGWQIQIIERIEPNDCESSRIGNCNLRVRNSDQGNVWTPVFPTIQGGSAMITSTATVSGKRLRASVNVRIYGDNPGREAVTAECGGRWTDADQIACHESGWRQFTASGMPNLGGVGDLGIMQLCNTSPLVVRCVQRWNWRENVRFGIVVLGRKRNSARSHLDTHRVNESYPNSLNLSDDEVLQRETFQRYKGGIYWTWASRRRRWEPNPPNRYVLNVLEGYNP